MILWLKGSSCRIVHIHSRLRHCRRHRQYQELLQPHFAQWSLRLHLPTVLFFHRSEKGEYRCQIFEAAFRIYCLEQRCRRPRAPGTTTIIIVIIMIRQFIRRRNMSMKSLQGRRTPGSRDECRTAPDKLSRWLLR